MFKRDLGERIKHVRKTLLGLTIADFSKKIGSSSGFISSAENGKTAPGAEILNSICEIYSINGHWLLTGEGQPQAQDSPTVGGAVKEEKIPYEQYRTLETPEEIAEADAQGHVTIIGGPSLLPSKSQQIQQQLQKKIKDLELSNRLLQTRLDQTERVLSLLRIVQHETEEDYNSDAETDPDQPAGESAGTPAKRGVHKAVLAKQTAG